MNSRHCSTQEECYQLLTYKNDVDLEKMLYEWEQFYNLARPHGAHKGKTPYESLSDELAWKWSVQQVRSYYTLQKVALASMLNSLEVRVPFLDHEIVEYAFSLQNSLKLRRLKGIFVLKHIASRYLPQEITQRKIFHKRSHSERRQGWKAYRDVAWRGFLWLFL